MCLREVVSNEKEKMEEHVKFIDDLKYKKELGLNH